MWLSFITVSLLTATINYIVNQDQKQLTVGLSKKPTFTVREQSSELCDAGARQFTGTVNVTEDKSMFFWYLESRSNPETDPLLLWMSGQVNTNHYVKASQTNAGVSGPGASGEMGLFMGSGPCTVNPDGNSTKRLEYSWIDRANVVYIDQPIGVGFSKITDREKIAVNLEQGAKDIYSFLSTFSHDIFPNLTRKPWHIAGESMGGHYVTGYTKYIVSYEHENAKRGIKPRVNISSSIILNGYIDAAQQYVGYYDFFCMDWATDGRKAPLMNITACENMLAAIPECKRLGSQCRYSYDIRHCYVADKVCKEKLGKYFIDGVVPGGWDPYDNRHPCEKPPLCSNIQHGPEWKFLNRRWVQEKLGFDHFPFYLIDLDTNKRWDVAQNIHIPVTRELTWILDKTDIRVLFINGNNDIIINTPGQMRMLDEQRWKGQDNYRTRNYKPWYYKDGELLSDAEGWNVKKGGFWKGNEQLSFFAVNEAGHFSAHHQPEAIGAIVRAWLRDD
ncbi:Carboxypeptidase Y-like protein [Fusarium oxysporum f. sp. rapae]|uniref:Carboxypeptidase Y-like protein n=1 Tax=Fusarium oxysporum f. sp. rapae TaxID=485398 RepID=A0A8J5NF81_FUSOX|nr:Carboxypeptidase Y-like protein [Fusarium oxysporum f. sp. rapae]